MLGLTGSSNACGCKHGAVYTDDSCATSALAAGRIRAPAVLRNKRIEIALSPFGPKVRFGHNGLKEVGSLRPAPTAEAGFMASLMLPESAIATTATSLASNWKHLHLWTFNETDAGASISRTSLAMALSYRRTTRRRGPPAPPSPRSGRVPLKRKGTKYQRHS